MYACNLVTLVVISDDDGSVIVDVDVTVTVEAGSILVLDVKIDMGRTVDNGQ